MNISDIARIVDSEIGVDSSVAIRPYKGVLNQRTIRLFRNGFIVLTAVLYSSLVVGLKLTHAAPKAGNAYVFGFAICTLSSFVSFLVSEWAFYQPRDLFMGVAFGLVILRMFNLLFAFTVGMFFLKLNGGSLALAMVIAYFSYLALEVVYIHKKGLLLGQ